MVTPPLRFKGATDCQKTPGLSTASVRDTLKGMKRRTVLWGVFGAVLLASVVFGIRLYQRWSDTCVFGKVVALSDAAAVIEDRDGRQVTIRLREDATTQRGREVIGREEVAAGAWVLVVAQPGQDGALEAGVIRLVRPPRR